MNDYIKREDAINEICRKGCQMERANRFISMHEAKQFAVDVLDDIPAADVRETDKNYEEAIKCVISYNGYVNVLRKWEKLPLNSCKHILCPANYGWYDEIDVEAINQLQVLWMIAVMLFGEYGTSPRYGWIEKVEDFRKWCAKLSKE